MPLLMAGQLVQSSLPLILLGASSAHTAIRTERQMGSNWLHSKKNHPFIKMIKLPKNSRQNTVGAENKVEVVLTD